MSDPLRFDHSPFMRFLGLEVVRAEKGRIEVRLPFREDFLRHDGSDWLHGGVVSSLADIVGDYAVVTGVSDHGVRLRSFVDASMSGLRTARKVGSVVDFLSTKFGPYPFTSAGLIVDDVCGARWSTWR